MNLDSITFVISAVVAVFGATMMISQRNPVASVLYMIVSLVAQAVLYIQLSALFMGAVLIIVFRTFASGNGFSAVIFRLMGLPL